MANRVLVAIDDTGLSGLVAEAISAQMRPEETEVLVLQVLEPFIHSVPPQTGRGYEPEMAARRKDRAERARTSLDGAVQILRQAGFRVSSELLESEIKAGIVGVAASWKADLIVVASHARKGVAKFFHHSVAEAVVHGAPCSVLVLKEFAAAA